MPKKLEYENDKRPKRGPKQRPNAKLPIAPQQPSPKLSNGQAYEELASRYGIEPPPIIKRVEDTTARVLPDSSAVSRKHQYVHIDAQNRTIINGMTFEKVPSSPYLTDYDLLAQKITSGEWDERESLREMCKRDLWFLTYFILGNKIANDDRNHWVKMCRMVQHGAKDRVLDLWAREHGKTTLLTENGTVQDLLVNPDETVAIFSYSRDAAKVFFKNIRYIFEGNETLKDLFRDIIWETPPHKGVQWNDDGIVLKRRFTQRECSIEPWGLLEGMPTGRHFSRRKYDDIETLDLANSPNDTQKMKDMFDMSENVGKDGGTCTVTGTFYSHDGVLCYIRDKRKPTGEPMYQVRKVCATEDGTINGKSVYLSEDRMTILKANKKFYYSQQLLDPTPKEDIKLPYSLVNQIRAEQVPMDVLKIMVIDPSGDGAVRRGGKKADAWAMWILGMDRRLRSEGFFNMYILDGVVAPMRHEDALSWAVRLYMRNGLIKQVGIEKTGQSTFDDHFSNALRVKGKNVTVDNRRMLILTTGGTSKPTRIEGALAAPLHNGTIHITDKVSPETKARLSTEMDKYGAIEKDDGLDALAYGYRMLQEFSLNMAPASGEDKKKKAYRDPYDWQEDKITLSWMTR
jgi:hypothetical protein